MKKESEKTRAAAPPGGPKTVTKADVMTREERLMQARRDFERTHTERLRRELVESSDPDARIEFPPMEKIWRNIMHELAADLNLHAESVELDVPAAEGDKYVVVYRKPPRWNSPKPRNSDERAPPPSDARARLRGRAKGRGAHRPGPGVRAGRDGTRIHRRRYRQARSARRRADVAGHAETEAGRGGTRRRRGGRKPGPGRGERRRKGRERVRCRNTGVRCRNTGARWFRRMCLVVYEMNESFGAKKSPPSEFVSPGVVVGSLHGFPRRLLLRCLRSRASTVVAPRRP